MSKFVNKCKKRKIILKPKKYLVPKLFFEAVACKDRWKNLEVQRSFDFATALDKSCGSLQLTWISYLVIINNAHTMVSCIFRSIKEEIQS